MSCKELPENIVGGHAGVRVEVGVVRNLPRHVHRPQIPYIQSADQTISLYFDMILAARYLLFDQCGGLPWCNALRSISSYAAAKWGGRIDASAAIRRRPGPVAEILIGRGHEDGARSKDESTIEVVRVLVALQHEHRYGRPGVRY